VEPTFKLNQIYRISQLSKYYEHGIKGDIDWLNFMPTKFIYSYFNFNTLYSINWYKSFQSTEIITFRGESKANNKSDLYQIEKINKLIDFYSSEIGDKLIDEYLNKLEKNLSYSFENTKMIVDKIDTSRGFINKIDNFKKSFEKISKVQATNKKERNVTYKDNLKEIFEFIYRVRNNIFHGTKTIEDMNDKNQKKRLSVYSSMLLSLIDLIFIIAKDEFNWHEPSFDVSLNFENKI